MSLRPIVAGAFLVLAAGVAQAQNFQLVLPRQSPHASVSQVIGLTEVSVSYHRPSVGGRKIWGGLVPYDSVWRAGANENTVLRISSPARIGGKDVPAGSYGLHMLPTASTWTIILSKQYEAWGSFSYRQGEDQTRFSVTPRAAEPTEQLQYTLDDPSDSSLTVTLRWEKLAVSFPIQVNTDQVVLDSLKQQFRSLPRFFANAWSQAGGWALTNTSNLDLANAWADSSNNLNPNFQALRIKAVVQERRGDMAGSNATMVQALAIANEAEVNAYGYVLLQAKRNDEAIAIFQRNVKQHPESWNTYDSLGEAFAAKGDKAKAAANYRKALSMAPEGQKARIQGILAGLS